MHPWPRRCPAGPTRRPFPPSARSAPSMTRRAGGPRPSELAAGGLQATRATASTGLIARTTRRRDRPGARMQAWQTWPRKCAISAGASTACGCADGPKAPSAGGAAALSAGRARRAPRIRLLLHCVRPRRSRRAIGRGMRRAGGALCAPLPAAPLFLGPVGGGPRPYARHPQDVLFGVGHAPAGALVGGALPAGGPARL